MGNSPVTGFGDEDGERMIDRSGDIDQRPPDERDGPAANIVPFKALVRSDLERPAALTRVEDGLPASRQVLKRRSSPAALAEITQRLQKDIDRLYAKAKAQLDAWAQKIEAQEKRCVSPRLDGDLQQVRFQRQKALIANGPLLARYVNDERTRLADLERFKAENRITRDAHYPDSAILGFGILGVLILLEAGINGVLFAESSDQGLLGGWLEAMVLAITNVGVAFLVGYIVLPQMNRRGLHAKAGGIALALAGSAALIAVNLFGAHYRDFKAAVTKSEIAAQPPAAPKRETTIPIAGQKTAPNEAFLKKAPQPTAGDAKRAALAEEKPKPIEAEALRRVFVAPFELESFTSLFLLIIGLCAATIAAADGYRFDDPFPGYGKRHRRYNEARTQSAAALKRVLNHANADIAGSYQGIDRKLENYGREVTELIALHHAYAGDYTAMTNRLEEAVQSGEADIACHDRLLNKVPDREALDRYALSAQTLPRLNEKHARFCENQEKKLKALQKAVQKAKDESLGIFEGVSEDFEKLLTEVVRGSLQTTSLNAGEDSRGT